MKQTSTTPSLHHLNHPVLRQFTDPEILQTIGHEYCQPQRLYPASVYLLHPPCSYCLRSHLPRTVQRWKGSVPEWAKMSK